MLNALETLRDELAKLPDVEHVQLDSVWAKTSRRPDRLGQAGACHARGMLGLGLVAVTFNTIRLQLLTQRDEIEVSRLLGATDAWIRRPFHWFGALQGLLGGPGTFQNSLNINWLLSKCGGNFDHI
jgi:cell division transport system permease protein